RVANRLVAPPHLRAALLHLWVGRVSGRRQAREVALDVGDEDRSPRVRQLAGEHLQRLRLAGPGRARDQAVAVEGRERDPDSWVVQRLVLEQGRADDQRRLGEAVAALHLLDELGLHQGMKDILRADVMPGELSVRPGRESEPGRAAVFRLRPLAGLARATY